MGFEFFYAGAQQDEVENFLMENGCNKLLSQLNNRTTINKWLEFKKNNPDAKNKLFIDSGAYTASTLGKVIDIDKYIEYMNEISDYVDIIAPLDVIPTSEQDNTEELSDANYKYMEERLKHPEKLIPVYHQGESYDHLRKLLSYGKDYIALGALVGATKNILRPFFTNTFRIIREYEKETGRKIKVHAFGMSSIELLESYPIYSADSTTYILSATRGDIMTPWGLITVSDMQKERPKNIINHIDYNQEILEEYLQSIGLSTETCIKRYQDRIKCNIHFMMNWCNNYKYKGSSTFRKPLF